MREAQHGRGAAAALLAHAIESTGERGAAGMWLGTHEEDLRARRFTAEHGFEQVGWKRFHLGDRDEHDLVLERRV